MHFSWLLFPLLTILPAFSASLPTQPVQEFHIRMLHLHTGERLNVVYRQGNAYVPEALAKVDHFLRDHRTGDVHHYDPRLLDLLIDLQSAVGRTGAEFQIICGYRTPWSNNFLRQSSTGVAKNSLHMQAEAIDIRLPWVKTSVLRDAALRLRRGGVGYYPKTNFIHVDLGRVRRW